MKVERVRVVNENVIEIADNSFSKSSIEEAILT